jgi:hypothetical protein
MAIRTFNSVGGFSVGENPTTIILANGDITTANATFTGNVAAGNVLTNNLLYANGSPWDFQLPAGSNNYVQYNNDGSFGASANFQFTPSTNLLTVTGNANISDTLSAANVTANRIDGNIYGNIYANTVLSGTANGVTYNNNGILTVSSGLTFNASANSLALVGNLTTGNANLGNLASANFVSGTLTTAAQPNITSVGTLTNLVVDGAGSISGANVVSANYVSGTLTTALQPNITQVGTLGSLSVLGNITSGNANLGNLASANFVSGTLTTGAQPNITSIGTLSSLNVTGNANVSGNVNAANLNVTARVISSMIPSINNNFDLGSSSNQWKDLYVSNINLGTAYIKSSANVILMDAANIANNLSTGTFTSRGDAAFQGNATIAGNLTVSGNTTYINVTNLDISDPLISMGGSGNGANATAYDGKDRGMILHNYYANGSGPINEAFIWKTGSNEFQAISQVGSITNEVVTASAYGNIRGEAFLGNLNGTVLQASQPNITSVGTLSNLTIGGNLRVNNTANLNSLIASGLSYPVTDGSAGQVLQTNGSGTLTWTTVSTSSLANGNSNISVYQNGNVTVSSNGVANILNVDGVSANPQVIITGSANISNTLTAGNTTVANLLIGNSTVRSETITTSSIGANQTIAAVSTTGVRGVIFDVKGENQTGGKYSVATVYCVHDGSGNVDYSVSGTVLLGGATGTLAVNISLNQILLGVTPATSASTVWTTQYRTI